MSSRTKKKWRFRAPGWSPSGAPLPLLGLIAACGLLGPSCLAGAAGDEEPLSEEEEVGLALEPLVEGELAAVEGDDEETDDADGSSPKGRTTSSKPASPGEDEYEPQPDPWQNGGSSESGSGTPGKP